MLAIALLAIVGCYAISVQASGERQKIALVRVKIDHDTAEIRLLRAELRTRARLPELQRWNTQVLALAAPRAEQMMANPLMLASYAADTHGTVVSTVVRDAAAPVPAVHDAVYGAPAVAAPATGFRKVSLR